MQLDALIGEDISVIPSFTFSSDTCFPATVYLFNLRWLKSKRR